MNKIVAKRLVLTVFFLSVLQSVSLFASRRGDVVDEWLTVLVPDTLTGDTLSIRMRRLESGTFVMGATPEQRSDEDAIDRPSHYVSLSSFYIAETEVTQRLWHAVTGSYAGPEGMLNPSAPVTWVSWYEAVRFCDSISSRTGYRFCLPTEAQWEYAARGGDKARETRFAGNNRAEDVGWVYSNSGNKTHEVAQKLPNEIGLYDMTGNVSEWCSDWIGPYRLGERPDPAGPETDSLGQPLGLNDYWSHEKVVRGGSWDNTAHNAHLSSRGHHAPDYISSDCGLRLAMHDPFPPRFSEDESSMPASKTIRVGKRKQRMILVNGEEPFYIAEDALTNADWVAVFGKHNEENLVSDKNMVRGVSRSRQEELCDRISRNADSKVFRMGERTLTLAVATEDDIRLAETVGVKLHTPKKAADADRQGSTYSRKRKHSKKMSVLAELIGVKVEVPEDKVLETLVEDKRNTSPIYLILK
ncbi:MAG: SUMF1/EgtB/PvdO family nonheme iron enzyme [Paludibacteraceae bacterium]|nr:SUMF1/EgtB/PvdO family nonheme iron enzyme [Paludibacteraceae bacterium]